MTSENKGNQQSISITPALINSSHVNILTNRKATPQDDDHNP